MSPPMLGEGLPPKLGEGLPTPPTQSTEGLPSAHLPSARRWLIVNADDFGLTAGVNAGIMAAHEKGVVTSASLMVRWPAAAEAARYAAGRKRFSLGLHIDFGEWQCVAGQWRPLYEVIDAGDPAAVRAELRRQLERFRELTGREPTHLDSHQHVHRGEPAWGEAVALAAELCIPLRDCTEDITYCGGFYGQADRGTPWPEGISRENLLRLLAGLPAGITELGCHPGEDDELQSMYRAERRQEVNVLCDQTIAEAIGRLGIERITFADVPAVRESRQCELPQARSTSEERQ